MNNLTFQIYHPGLGLLSDRTFRALLKKLSALAREIQAQEVLHLIRESELPRNLQQSLTDRLRPQLNHMPAYYVEDVRRGSLTLTIASTAFGLWLLQTTLGETVKEAWLASNFHKQLLDYLKSPVAGGRKEVLQKNIDLVVNNWTLDRFVVSDTSIKTDKNRDLLVRIELETPADLAEELEERSHRVDTSFVTENSQREIARLAAVLHAADDTESTD